jgi:hypothetical protein
VTNEENVLPCQGGKVSRIGGGISPRKQSTIESMLMTGRVLRFSWVPGQFAVCRLPPDVPLPEWAWTGPFTSVTRTADELLIMCLADNIPRDVDSKHHWMCFKVEGPFAFSEVGILASFIDPLAENGVPVFAVSTYDTTTC